MLGAMDSTWLAVAESAYDARGLSVVLSIGCLPAAVVLAVHLAVHLAVDLVIG